MNSLNQLNLVEAKNGLKTKKYSSLELTKACLQRIKDIDSQLNAFITVCEKEALGEAKKADFLLSQGEDLPLLGLPIALKDLYVTKGIRTTAASKVLEDYTPQYDASVVKKIKEAGAVIIGKTNGDAWAHGASGENSDFGKTLNPWNWEYVPGGSSSGSAVAVASEMCLIATGTDTGGSIRQPASFCNVVGLKPTYGRVSRYGIISMASSLDSIGHFAKTVEDAAYFLKIIAGKDLFDGSTSPLEVPDYLSNLEKDLKGIKIGIPKEYYGQGTDPQNIKLIEKALKILEGKGVVIQEISLPHTEYAISCYYIVQPAEVSSNLARYDGIRFGHDRSFFGDEAKRRIMLGTFVLSVGYYEAYYKQAMKVRTLIRQDFEKAFQKVDAIITPVSPTLPWKLGEKIDDPLKMYLADIFTVTANLAGLPGLSVPVGFANKLPVGMQILGPQFSEELLFQIGHAYEKETVYHKQKPKL